MLYLKHKDLFSFFKLQNLRIIPKWFGETATNLKGIEKRCYNRGMKIFIASDSYKGCMSSREANEHIKIGLLRADPGVKTSCFCISDGGEGFVEAYADAASARLHTAVTQDLYGKPVYARYAYHAQTRTVCVEAASVLGLMLYARPERHPMDASSFGLGLLCKNLMQTLPVSRLIIGLGGTGTNDGGMGFLAAFGAKFFDRSRHQIKPCAQNLAHIAFIDKREFRFPRIFCSLYEQSVSYRIIYTLFNRRSINC